MSRENYTGISFERLRNSEPEIMQLYGGALVETERILYPTSEQEVCTAESALLEELASACLDGRHVAIVDGAFDVPHANHTWYLREARLRAAKQHFGVEMFEEASIEERRAMVASDEIVLIVTLDADAKISDKKGLLPGKGGAPRPIYPWEARASRIGGLMVPSENGNYRPVLDLVTVEGDPSHTGSIFESHLGFGKRLAQYGLLGTWVLYDEHGDTVDEASSYVDDPSVISIVKQQDSRFSLDPRTNKHWSSSAIINRIRGGAQNV